MRVRHLPFLMMPLLAALACGGGDPGTSTGTTGTTKVVGQVNVSPPLATVEQGTTAAFTADIRDQFGAVLPGKTATWSSSSPAVATVDASGLVTGVSVGTATITATADGKSGSASAAVFPPPVKSVSLSAPPANVTAGQAFTLVAALKDRNGGALSGRVVTWTSSAVRVAAVDANGNVTAVSGGSTVVTATSEGVSATVTVVVASPPGTTLASIGSVSPATLTPGAAGTISGTNFIAGAANDIVWVAGIPATVTSATTTQIKFTVPPSGIPCQSTQSVPVEVTTVAGTVGVKQSLAVATQRTLAVGQSFLTSATGSAICNELPSTGTYLVSVFNASKNLTQSASFELTGAAGGQSLNVTAANQGLRARVVPSATASLTSPVDPAFAVAETEHLRRLEAGAQFRRQYGPPRRYPRSLQPSLSVAPGQPSASSAVAPFPTTVGSTTTIHFNYNSCTAAASPLITARVVYVGPRAIVLEDNASPLAGKIDADMIAMAQDYETVSWPILLKFGNPLAYDDSLARNGRVAMLFTPRVNQAGSNLLGFVQSCDFFPTTFASTSGSNMTEIFYARAVTDTSATSTSLNGRPTWKRYMPSTLIHESKHIIKNAEESATPVLVTTSEETWLEEATAQLASEMYGRAIHGNGWRSNASYFGTLDCEVRPTTPGCGGGIVVMGNHYAFLTDFLENIESKTILSGGDDNDIYGSSWLFTRWLVDTYGGADESVMLHAMVTNYNVTGVDNVTSVSGKTWPELLSQFSLMLAADDLSGVSLPNLEASWNLPGVFAGYASDLASHPPAQPLVPRAAAFGSFTTSTVTLRGGGVMLVRMSGTASGATQLFDLHQAGGGALPASSTIGISILRVQ